METINPGKTMGNDSLVYRPIKENEITGSGDAGTSTVPGKFYLVKTIADTASAFEGGTPMCLYYATKAKALASGDSAIPLKIGPDQLLAFTRDKSISITKASTDATTDADLMTSNIVSPIPGLTGSLSGFNTKSGPTSAASILKSRFLGRTVLDEKGEYVSQDITNDTEGLLFLWDHKYIKSGDRFEATYIPCVLTSNTRGATYDSPDPLDFEYSGQSMDDEGFRCWEIESNYIPLSE